MQIFGPKMQFFGPKSIFLPKASNFFVTIMTGQQKDNIFVLTPLHGGPRAGRRGPFLAQNSAFFYATPMKPPFFRVVRTRLNGIISPPYPEATLDNFGFPVGGRLAARRAVFWPPGRILAVFGVGGLYYISTPNFEMYLTKLVGTIRVTKKRIWSFSSIILQCIFYCFQVCVIETFAICG